MQLRMVGHFLLLTFLIEIGSLHSDFADAALVNVVTGDWNGVVFYISVRRDAIQKKLDSFHSSRSNGCSNGPNLLIPDVSVLPELHNVDRHPVYIGIGYATSHDFSDYLKDNPDPHVSVSGLEVSVTIPLLARTATGPPDYALALAKFYEKSRGDIPKINVIYPYIPTDEIILNNDGAVVRKGSDEMRVSFNRINQTYCRSPISIVKEEFDAFIQSEFHFGLPSPEYSFCDRHCFKSEFCENAEQVKCGVSRYAPNICQKWYTKDILQCATKVTIENITSGFRDFILLGDDPINILASDNLHKNFTLALKYPCQD